MLEFWVATPPWDREPEIFVSEFGVDLDYSCCYPAFRPEELTGLLIDLARHLPKKDRKTLHRRLAAIADAW